MKLNDNQKEIVLEFFNVDNKYPGWKGIADKLIDNGHCIVAGTECIWRGGIGNFINTEDPGDDIVGCLKYTFDLDNFLSSVWFQGYLGYKEKQVYEEKRKIENLYTDLINLKK